MRHYPTIDLNGATVAITGGAQGIGRATAELFAARGAKVAIGDLNVDLAQQAAADFGGSAHPLDVSDPQSYHRFLDEAAAAHGDLDVTGRVNTNRGAAPTAIFFARQGDVSVA